MTSTTEEKPYSLAFICGMAAVVVSLAAQSFTPDDAILTWAIIEEVVRYGFLVFLVLSLQSKFVFKSGLFVGLGVGIAETFGYTLGWFLTDGIGAAIASVVMRLTGQVWLHVLLAGLTAFVWQKTREYKWYIQSFAVIFSLTVATLIHWQVNLATVRSESPWLVVDLLNIFF